ncbi:MAG: glycosyltransferase family 8 protein [Oscillospiraceae bacterium]|jgi:lipopolysaccharide biosynthesis glycosyltransferase|nr:glycosyltransferase family 8 protein [Oscillospiraceae bacterium]
MKMDKIPIVMSFDENYAMPACVTAYSVLRSKAEDTQYSFYFLVHSNVPIDVVERFDKLVEQYPGTKIDFIIIGDKMDIAVIGSHYSVAAYFRLLIPELLFKLDKCLYIDVDLIVCADLTELWEYDIGNNVIAGVKNISGGKEQYKKLKLPTPNQYISSGVLIINLRAIRDEKLIPKLLELITEGYKYVDQDVLNKVCYNRILLLPLKYNIYFFRVVDKNILSKLFPKNEVEEALNNPVIIHYPAFVKPWDTNDDRVQLLCLWYRTALKSPYHYDHSINMLKGYKNAELIKITIDYRVSIEYRIGQIITFLPKLIKKLILNNME